MAAAWVKPEVPREFLKMKHPPRGGYRAQGRAAAGRLAAPRCGS